MSQPALGPGFLAWIGSWGGSSAGECSQWKLAGTRRGFSKPSMLQSESGRTLALLRKVLPLSFFFRESELGIQSEQARAISDTEDSRHKSIEKNNFFLFTKKIQILDAVNKIHNLFPLESVFHQLFFCL